jgi:large subunit ribosomal protein L4
VQATIYNLAGQEVEKIDLDDTIFGITPNHAVIHQAVLRQQANARQGTHSTKTRAFVRGGGIKPWRQKGTGRARQGSRRSPQWRHGGVVFGPHPRSYEQEMPRKARRLAIRSVLSGKLADGQLMIVDGFEDIEPRTRAMKDALAALNIGDNSALIFTTGAEANLKMAAGNLPHVKMLSAHLLSVVDMLKHDFVILPRPALDVVTGILGNTGGRRKLVLRGREESNGSAKPAATTAAKATAKATAKTAEASAPARRTKKAAAEAKAENVAFEPTGEVAEVAAATETEAAPKAAPKRAAAKKASTKSAKKESEG